MIQISNLCKSFRSLKVLREVSVEIPSGEVTAIVGPNGSGKSTLIKCILGLALPDSGTILLDGLDISTDYRYRKEIGYMPQIAKFPDNLTAGDVLRLLEELRIDSSPQAISQRPFDLNSELNKKTRTLSGGTKQKLNACVAMLFSPSILILDEPTAGLDPLSSSQLKDRVRREKERGTTVVLTSHIMSEVQELSDNIIFLLEGRVLYQGTVAALISETSQPRLELAVAELMKANGGVQ